MARCKCKICGRELDGKTAYRVEHKSHFGHVSFRNYCSQEEYETYTKAQQEALKLKNDITDVLAYIFDVHAIVNTYIHKEWKEWNQIASNEIIFDYLNEHKEWLREKITSITSSEFARIKYLSAVLKNSLTDYKKSKEHTVTITTALKPVTAEEYISKYLDPHLDFKPDVPMDDRIKIIINPKFEDDSLIAQAINKLSYDEFLATPYWDTITYYKRSKVDFKCTRCGSGTNTQSHHTTYVHHGYEHRQEVIDNDLVVLCKDCHQKEHNIVNDDDDEI